MIRDESIKALAEAYGDDGDARWKAEWLLSDPTLARRLDLGTAWDDAVAALPAGWSGPVLYPNPLNAGWHAEAFQDVTSDGSLDTFGGAHANAPDPTDALVALTAALRERQP